MPDGAKTQSHPRATRGGARAEKIPDDFPGAAYLRDEGVLTFGDLFAMSHADLEAAASVVGAEMARRIASLRFPDLA